MHKEKYLGVDVCTTNMQEALDEVESIIKIRKPSFIVAINPEKIMKATQDSNLKAMLNSAAIQIPDGVGVLIASKLIGGKIKKRVTGIDLMQSICKLSSDNGYGVFLLGAKPDIAETAAKILKRRYPKLNIVGIRDGYFKDDEEITNYISKCNPDVLFVAMGSPKQEYWITKNMGKLNIPVCMGVGGSYDVICGNIKRAPKWMCKLGLEWLYRLIKEPWRYKRMLVLPKFLIRVLLRR